MSEYRIRIRSWWRKYWWPSVIRQLKQERNDWKRWLTECEGKRADVREADELLELAWGLIANSYGGDWDQASEQSGWKVAAERWRDRYHE